MPSKEVTDRKKSAGAVVSSIEAHAEAVGQSLAAQFKAVLRKGESAPDVALALRLFGRLLARDNAAVVEADDRHEAEKADDDAPRTTRDDAAAQVREACTHARDGVETVYGEAALKALGMEAAPPSVVEGAALLRWATTAAAKLADAKLALPKAQKKGVSVDRGALAEGITEHLGTLKTSIEDVDRERRELEGTQAVKNRAVERNDATFSLVAGVADAVLRAAGMPEQADRVRPSARRPGRVATTDGGAPATGTPDGGATPTG